MKSLKHQILLITLLIGFTSCTKAIIEDVDPSTLPPLQEDVKYDPDVKALVFNFCSTCHTGAAASGGVELSTYENVKFYTEKGNLFQRMQNAANPMPPSGILPAAQRQIIEKWIQDGYPEN